MSVRLVTRFVTVFLFLGTSLSIAQEQGTSRHHKTAGSEVWDQHRPVNLDGSERGTRSTDPWVERSNGVDGTAIPLPPDPWKRVSQQADDRVLFTVNSLQDTPDARPGDGIARDAAGRTSLRSAIEESNTLSAGVRIRFEVTGTIELDVPMAAVLGDVVLEGPGIDLLTVLYKATDGRRIFTTALNGKAFVSGVRLRYDYSAFTSLTLPASIIPLDAGARDIEVSTTAISIPGMPSVPLDGSEIALLDNPATLTIDGNSGTNSLSVTMTGPKSGFFSLDGGPMVLFRNAGSLAFNGGRNPGDEMKVFGDGTAQATYSPSSTVPGDGAITVDGFSLIFTGLSPVTINGVASFTLTLLGDAVVLVDTPAPGQNRISGTVGGVPFESVTFFDVPLATVNMSSGGTNSLAVDANGLNATLLTNFNVNGGTGTDDVTISSTNPAVAVSVDGGAGTDRLQVNAETGIFDPMVVHPTGAGAGSVSYFMGNAGTVTYANIENLALAGQIADGDNFGVEGTVGDDSFVFQQGAAPDQGTVTGTLNQNIASFALTPIAFSGMPPSGTTRINNFGFIGGSDQFTYSGTGNAETIALNTTSGYLTSNVGATLWSNIWHQNFSSEVVNAGAGNDIVDVSSTLATPTIAVNGGADGDMLRVNAESGVFDPMVVSPTASGAGLVWFFNANAANVTYNGIEQIDLLGQLADGDAFGVDGTAGNDQFVYQQGAAPDQGTVTGTMNQNGVAFPLPTITFSGMAQASLLRFNNFSGIGGSDQFVYTGTGNAETIALNTTTAMLTSTVGATLWSNIWHQNFSSETVLAGAGNDVIDISSTQPTPTVAVNGDAGSDILRMNAEAGVFDPMVVTPTIVGIGTVSYFFGNAANVAYAGIEQIDLIGQLVDGDAFGVDGTFGNDGLAYQQGATPDQGVVTGSMNQTGVPFPLPTITFSGMAQASVMVFNSFGQQGGSDQFTYTGTVNAENIAVNPGGGNYLTSQVGATLFSNLQLNSFTSQIVNGNDGADAFTVTPSAGRTMAINGQNPVCGTNPGDVLNMALAGVTSPVLTISSPCTGQYTFGNRQAVSFTSIESIGPADLAVTKLDSPDPVIAGTNLTYSITITNGGSNDAQNVSLSDAIPAGTTFVSATASAGATLTTPPVGGTGTVTSVWTGMTAAGGVRTLTVVVLVLPSVPLGTILSNTAIASSDNTDPNPANNTATATTAVTTRADLSIGKTGVPNPVYVNQNVTYTINASNAGESDAQTVQIADALPPLTTFVSAIGSAGAALTTPPVGGTGTVTATWAGGTPPTTVRSLTLTIKTGLNLCAGSVTNTATVASTTSDPNPANNTSSFTITVIDNVPPSVTCPANIIRSTDPGQCSAVVTYVASASDNCGLASFTCTPPSGSVFPKGVTTTTCTAVDVTGNSAACSFTITVNDTELPQLTAPGPLTLSADFGVCGKYKSNFNLGTPVVSDNCPGVTYSNNAPNLFPVGTTIVTWTAVDASGNIRTATQSVTIIDNQPPSVNAYLTPTTLVPANQSMRSITAYLTVTDNCPGATFVLYSVTSSDPDAGTFPGDLPNDIQGAGLNTPDTQFYLRAERGWSSRTYTVKYRGKDAANNATMSTRLVVVPVYAASGGYVSKDPDGENQTPQQVRLDQNYPNPFNPATVIRYGIPADGHVRLTVYNMLARRVAVITDEFQTAGSYTATFDGSALPSGLYTYVLEAGGTVLKHTMSLVK